MVNPAYSTNNPQAICNGGSYTFNSHTYTTAGTYYDTLSSVNGCDSIIVTQLTVVMVFSSNNIQSICNGSTYTINSHAYTTTGNYHDTLTSVGGCDSIIATQLTVNPLPSVYTGNDTTIVSGSPVQLNAAAAATSFLWSTGDTAEKITVSPTTNTTYYVTATDANGCQTVDSVRITIEDSQHYISVPNIFSPNGDGNNDFIKVHGLGVKEFKLLIYDRWGEMIFSATGGSAYGGETVEWDGTFKGKPLNSAVFIYMLDATFTNATTFTEKGNITLVK